MLESKHGWGRISIGGQDGGGAILERSGLLALGIVIIGLQVQLVGECLEGGGHDVERLGHFVDLIALILRHGFGMLRGAALGLGFDDGHEGEVHVAHGGVGVDLRGGGELGAVGLSPIGVTGGDGDGLGGVHTRQGGGNLGKILAGDLLLDGGFGISAFIGPEGGKGIDAPDGIDNIILSPRQGAGRLVSRVSCGVGQGWCRGGGGQFCVGRRFDGDGGVDQILGSGDENGGGLGDRLLAGVLGEFDGGIEGGDGFVGVSQAKLGFAFETGDAVALGGVAASAGGECIVASLQDGGVITGFEERGEIFEGRGISQGSGYGQQQENGQCGEGSSHGVGS